MPDLGFFFTKEGIISHHSSFQPLLPFVKTTHRLSLCVTHKIIYHDYFAVECTHALSPETLIDSGYTTYPIKYFLSKTEESLRALILSAYQMLNWHKQSRYCGQCGQPLQGDLSSTKKHCPSCQKNFFPRFSPAMMVLIEKGHQILLARSAHFATGMYSALAGFVDVGESAEQALHREVKEEVGLAVTDLRYFATQSWPFPDSFMIAFKATYLSGEIVIDPEEIEDARWFDLDNLPALPPHASISRRLIDSVLLSR